MSMSMCRQSANRVEFPLCSDSFLKMAKISLDDLSVLGQYSLTIQSGEMMPARMRNGLSMVTTA